MKRIVNTKHFLGAALAVAVMAFSVMAQKAPNYSYAAQKAFIPVQLGRVFLGMPLKDLAGVIDLKTAEADGRFDYLELKVPFSKGDVTGLSLRVHGLSSADKEAALFKDTVTKKGDTGEEYATTVWRLRVEALPANGIVYAMYVTFNKDFDQKSYVVKTFGKNGDVRAPDEQYHLYDIQWTKKTSDGLTWLIRSFHEGKNRSLQLLGRMPGTEWDSEN